MMINRTSYFKMLLATLCIMISFVAGCCKEENGLCVQGTPVPHAYQFDRKELYKVVNKLEHNDRVSFITRISRSSDGTKLYIHVDNKVVIISKEGIEKERKAPGTIYFMDDEGNFIAWAKDISGPANFYNGQMLKSYMALEVAPGGQYLFLQNDFKTIQIRSTNHPDVSLAVIFPPEGFAGLQGGKIFVDADKIYIFYYTLTNINPLKFGSLIVTVYKREGEILKLDQEKQLSSDSLFYVADFDTNSKNVLLLYLMDIPLSFLDSWHLLNLEKHELKKLNYGFVSGYEGIFLKENLLLKAEGL